MHSITQKNMYLPSFANIYFGLGFVLFFVNMFSDVMFGIPAFEVIITGMMLLGGVRVFNKTVPLYLMLFAMLVWVVVACIATGIGINETIRSIFKVALIFLPVLLYMGDKKQERYLSAAIGFIAAYTAFFAINATLSVFEYGTFDRTLRYVLPSSTIIFLMLAIYWRQRSDILLKYFWLFSLLSIFLVGMFIQSRGTFVGMAMVLGCIGSVIVFGRKNSLVVSASYITVPAIPTMLTLGAPVLHYIISSNMATKSNLERTYLIKYSVEEISNSPWFGVGQDMFKDNFQWVFKMATKLNSDVIGPHNLYLEFSIMYGLPFILLMIITMLMLFRTALKYSPSQGYIIATSAAVIINLAAFTGFSGIGRVEVLAAWFVMLYGWQNNLYKPQNTNQPNA